MERTALEGKRGFNAEWGGIKGEEKIAVCAELPVEAVDGTRAYIVRLTSG